jgi:hypothetical protein
MSKKKIRPIWSPWQPPTLFWLRKVRPHSGPLTVGLSKRFACFQYQQSGTMTIELLDTETEEQDSDKEDEAARKLRS